MPIMLISYGSNQMMLSSPQEWNVCAHSVATHDSIKQAAVPGKAQEDVKYVGSDSIQSLLVVTASKVCRE